MDIISFLIWLTGFVILVVWIIIPIKEFKRILSKRKKENENTKEGEAI